MNILNSKLGELDKIGILLVKTKFGAKEMHLEEKRSKRSRHWKIGMGYGSTLYFFVYFS